MNDIILGVFIIIRVCIILHAYTYIGIPLCTSKFLLIGRGAHSGFRFLCEGARIQDQGRVLGLPCLSGGVVQEGPGSLKTPKNSDLNP